MRYNVDKVHKATGQETELNSAGRWSQVEDMARGALELEPEERSAYLDSVCGEQSDLRPKVDELVAAYETARLGATVLSRPSFKPQPAIELEPGQKLGGHQILERVADGSMATVYKATLNDGAGGLVAVKVARQGFDVGCLTQHFENECRILEELNHPNIARSLGGGTLDDGRPYMVVDFVEGLPINDYCVHHHLALSGRLCLFGQVCDAVHHAHGKGVIHRDIKPINVLVTEQGVPVLLDFGIAQYTISQYTGEPAHAECSSEALMTPQYASPEQIRGLPVSPLSDIYSLGLVLYELLTGRLPYEGNALGPREMAHILDVQQPAPPSSVTECPEIRHQLEAGLETVILQALNEEPARRPTAEQFARALQPWMT